MARALVLLLVLVALPLPHAAAATTVPGAIHGAGTVSTFYVKTGGEFFEGGAFDWNFACAGCYVRFTVVSGTFDVVQNGAIVALAPGSYQIPGFAGYIGMTVNGPHDFFWEIHGTGQVSPWSP
ncbi:MAG: hypothetical protein QOE90_465 [Thermoplasmata archaeon]|nr:hypothetical protein [Thermoplasmata archaeon]